MDFLSKRIFNTEMEGKSLGFGTLTNCPEVG